MMRTFNANLAIAGMVMIATVAGAQTRPSSATKPGAPSGSRARNVILFLGDGMGDSEITIARYYHAGAAGHLNMDSLPMTGEYTTWSVKESNPNFPEYVPDSAATGTAWATGHKTSNGRISTVAGTSEVSPMTTILEMAQAAGFKTGNVSTAEITDATPAVLGSHVNDRGCQGPANMGNCAKYKKSNGGPGSIAEQLVDHHIDVILGGGRSRFEQTIDGGPYTGQTVVQSATAQGYTYVTDSTGLGQVTPGKKVLGLFNAGNMTLEWTGDIAKPYPGSGPQVCKENQRPSNEPSLAAMTTKAIQLLELNASSTSGFFLQVEGASIDKQDHASNPCGQIGENIAFDEAIKVGLEYAKKHPDTLIVVTADHGHTSQIIEPPNSPNQPGAFSILTTKDGSDMVVSYASQPVGASQSHTGTEVRIAAQGPQSERVLGVTDQTDLFHTMAIAMGLE